LRHRFGTHPGEQLQIDLRERQVEIGAVAVEVFSSSQPLATRARCVCVRMDMSGKTVGSTDRLESAFRAFGGVPREVLLNDAKALILHHDPANREAVLHLRLHVFARHWGCESALARRIGHRRQERAWLWLRQAERYRGPVLCHMVGDGSPSRSLVARDRRCSDAWHEG
jgi:hypothetical protein